MTWVARKYSSTRLYRFLKGYELIWSNVDNRSNSKMFDKMVCLAYTLTIFALLFLCAGRICTQVLEWYLPKHGGAGILDVSTLTRKCGAPPLRVTDWTLCMIIKGTHKPATLMIYSLSIFPAVEYLSCYWSSSLSFVTMEIAVFFIALRALKNVLCLWTARHGPSFSCCISIKHNRVFVTLHVNNTSHYLFMALHRYVGEVQGGGYGATIPAVQVTISGNKVITSYTREVHFSNLPYIPYPTNRKGTKTRHKNNASLAQTPENPSRHPARSIRRHSQQLRKKSTPQSRRYWSTCHSTHDKTEPTYNQIRNKNHSDETGHWTQYSWWCAGFCLPTTWSSLKSFSRWDVKCLCFHWLVQKTKQHPFLISAGAVYTICVSFFFWSYQYLLFSFA